MTERDKVKQKIVALLAKTEGNGASEHEALAAAEKAAELMAHYDIEATELDFKSRSCVKKETEFRTYGRLVLGDGFAVSLARLCDVKCWLDPRSGKQVFFGFDSDAEIAVFLYDTLCSAIESEIEKFKNSDEYAIEQMRGYNGRSLVTSFIHGMTGRISGRLSDMAHEKRATVQRATGTALVPVKEAQIAAEFEDLGMSLVSRRTTRTVRNRRALGAGVNAGNRVNIGAGVAGTKTGGLLK